MTERDIWALIDSDSPRVWNVFVNGSWFARELGKNADHIFEQCRAWLRDAYHFECEKNKTMKVGVMAICPLTDERCSSTVFVDV